MHSRLSITETLVAAWVVALSCSISAGWILSSANAIGFIWIVPLAIWLPLFVVLYRQSQQWEPGEKRDMLTALSFPPFLILALMIFVAGFMYLPVTHDSLSYRIPRMYLWLQEGHVGYVATSDDRINYMTQNWELASLPILQIFGPRFLCLVSTFSWIALYLVGREWAGIGGFRDQMRNWVGLLPTLCTFSVLQARSSVNDLLAATLILTSAWFIISFHRSPGGRKVVLSAFALALACGTKPHFIVLAVPWAAWFVFAKPAVWRIFPWRHLPWLLPLLLFVSPASAFLINTIETGSFKGTTETGDFIGGNPLYNVPLGTLSFVWQSLQLPFNPLAGVWNNLIRGNETLELVTREVPRFGLLVNYAQIVDGASLGLFVMIPCLVGWFYSFRDRDIRGIRFVAAAGVGGFLLAVSQVVPGSIGRSFMGFAFLCFPLAMAGLHLVPPRTVKGLTLIALLAAIATNALDASRPLLPVKQIAGILEATGAAPDSMTVQVKNFVAFRERADAGMSLYHKIPAGSRVAVISGGGDPLVRLWTEAQPATVALAPAGANYEWLVRFDPDAIVVTGTGPEMHAGLIEQVAAHYRRVATDSYVVRLQRGREKWELFAR